MKARITGSVLAALASFATITSQPTISTAQPPAFALGKPLADPAMSAGSVSVRVIAGSPASPVIGTEVTLIVNGQPQLARTDASGRANFSGLPAGATVQAKIKDAEGKEQTSDSFQVPSAGGQRLMLSTKPFTGGGPMAGGGGGGGGVGGPGMPEPRKLNGQARQDRETEAGTLVVRLTYNDLAAQPNTPNGPPAGVPVFLVGYASDDSVIVKSVQSDAAGRVAFPKLDMTGNVGYFTLANLPRGSGVDRVYSMPVQLDGQAGFRTILSGEKRDSTAPNIDQHQSPQAIPTPAGKVRVTLEGLAQPGIPVRLVDATTGKVLVEQPTGSLEADPATMTGGSTFTAKPEIAVGTLAVTVHGGLAATDGPLGGVEIRVIAADAQGLDGAVPVTSGADGKLELKIPEAIVAKPVRVVFRILGRDFVSDVIDASKTGGTLDIKANWAAGGRPHVLFDLPYQPNQVVYAEAIVSGTKLDGTYRSLPFLAAPSTGVHLAIIVYPRVMMKFQMRAMIEDQLLAVSGKWTVDNNSWIPYRASPDGMMIPAPKGFKGGVIADMNQNDVAVVPGEGFRILRPLPPGSSRPFVAGFSLAVDDGNADWALDLPLGTVGSEIAIRQNPGMKVQLPDGVTGRTEEMSDGSSYFRIADIRIPRGRSMAMTITGLPSPPSWKVWAPRIVGVFVILMIVGGVALALARSAAKTPDTVNLARKQALLDELVELERSGADNRRREQLIAELEKLWSA